MSEEMKDVVERVRSMERRLAYQGALAKHYTGPGATNAIERKLCEESGKDAEALSALIRALEKGERTIGHRNRRIDRLVRALDYAREKGVVFPGDVEKVVQSTALTGSREQEADNAR